MRYPTLAILLALALWARENPFKPVIKNTVLPAGSEKEKIEPFEKATVTLPVDARVLTSVAIYYQSLDGSIKKEIVTVDKAIDWHKPILITQQSVGTPETKEAVPAPDKAPEKGSKKREKRSETATKAKTAPPATTPKKKTQAKRAQSSEAPAKKSPLPFLAYAVEGKSLHLFTGDEKIRAFHLTHPFKIVVDFRRKARFLSRHIPLNSPPFVKMDIGNHDGYYRVVITLDAPYRYRIEKRKEGYVLRVR